VFKVIHPVLYYCILLCTERHHERHRRIVEKVQFVDYTLQCMRNLDSGSQTVMSDSQLQWSCLQILSKTRFGSPYRNWKYDVCVCLSHL